MPAPIPPSAFVDVARGRQATAGGFYGLSGTRLRTEQTLTTAIDGFSFASSYVFPVATASQTPCSPETLPDGQLYCVPTTASYFEYDSAHGNLFADAACTELYAQSVSNTCVAYAADPSATAFYKRSDCTEAQPSELAPVRVGLQH